MEGSFKILRDFSVEDRIRILKGRCGRDYQNLREIIMKESMKSKGDSFGRQYQASRSIAFPKIILLMIFSEILGG